MTGKGEEVFPKPGLNSANPRKNKVLCFIAFFFVCVQSALACPPCPTGASTTGRGVVTTSRVCRCDNTSHVWDGTSCVASGDCSGTTLGWLTNCGASVGTTTNGTSVTLSNANSGYTGSATFTCNSGTWSAPSSATCSSSSCPATTLGWLTNCGASVTTTSTGTSLTLSNTNTGYTGSATFSCSNGTWSAPSSATCGTSGCASGSKTWGSCTGSHTAAAPGETRVASDTTNPYQGDASYYCNSDGTWTLQAGSTCGCRMDVPYSWQNYSGGCTCDAASPGSFIVGAGVHYNFGSRNPSDCACSSCLNHNEGSYDVECKDGYANVISIICSDML